MCVNLSNWSETRDAINSVLANQDVDLLVNNAAYAKLTPITDANIVSEEDIDNHFDVNVKAVINITQLVAKSMMKKKNGAIVNISSQASLAALADHLVYCASKAALDALTRVMALDYGRYNIRTNSVCPTVVWTDMAKVGWSDEKKAADMTAKIPLGRFAEVDEVVDAIVYLLSDKSSMINGVSIPIDGGFCAC